MKDTLRDQPKRLVVPGMRLCPSDDERYQSGNGTYILHGYIYASLAGRVKLTPLKGKNDKEQDVMTVEVDSGKKDMNVVPKQGDIVTARVLSVNPRHAKLHILCVRDTALSEPFRATLRKEDVRATEKDRVEMYQSFKPTDIILARVLSLGEASSGYLVTTAENELGVAIAKSAATGKPMVPVSWTEMQCPDTFVKEMRKIAKICPENLVEMAKTIE